MELTGTLLGGRYRVGQVLGRGGMGVVYEAVQEGIDRPVALKVMYEHLASDASIRERFKREARAVAKIRHPNVVQINDYVEGTTEPPFLVMEKLSGETLRDLMKGTTPISGERMARIALQVLAALDAAHQAKVVHRDIKPDNIFLERTTAQRDIVKLLDFGVSKFLGESDEAIKLTRMGHAIGTPSFMAPEQAVGDAVDGRADLYALGATMFIALTGKKIYEVREASDLVRTIMTTVPPLVHTLRPDVHPDLSRVIACALEKNASARYANAIEMTRALSPFGKIPTSMVESVDPTPMHDTHRDPVVETTAPMVQEAHASMMALSPAPAKSERSLWPVVAIAAGLFGVIVIGAGVFAIYSEARSPETRPARAAGATTNAKVTALPTPGEIATLTPAPAPDTASVDSSTTATASATATATAPVPTFVPTAPPASLVATSNAAQPPECAAAKAMKAQGQERQAAQLALRCMRKGGSPPF